MLLTDGEQRATLALARSLGKAGYRVHVTSVSGRSLAGASRFTHSDHEVPDALSNPQDFSRSIEEICKRLGVRVLIPVTEASLLSLLAMPAGTLPPIPFPPYDTFSAICDKQRVLSEAVECGIAAPHQLVIRDRSEAAALDTSPLKYPLVIKPARSVNAEGEHRVKLGVAYAADWGELMTIVSKLPDAGFPLLLQQRVIGPGVGVFLLVWQGRLIARFSHRRIREKPPAGGVSVYRESIPANPGLVERSRNLLERFHWSGVAMIEYKVEEQTGTPYLMEINGRFWGSLQLAIDAGVDFPRLLVELALGGSPAPVEHYATGVRSRWWWGDVDHLLTRLRRSDAALGLPPGAPRRSRALFDFLTFWRPGDRNEILRWSDPAPFIRETLHWLSGH